jgi:NAD(P)-dependent dehydrogenase (short-subunit alcohol dehydrogenase family)
VNAERAGCIERRFAWTGRSARLVKTTKQAGAGRDGGTGRRQGGAGHGRRVGRARLAVDLNEAAAEETASIIREEGGDVTVARADVSSAKDVEAMVAACVEAYGRIDILHNNVGIVEVGGPVDLSEEAWDRVNDVNLKSMFLTHKYALPVMAEQAPNAAGQRGSIVNISSVSGIRYTGVPYVSYATTKGAILPFTQSVALEYAGRGIRANAILPGLMDTPMIVEPLTAAYGASVDEMKKARDAQCPLGHMGDAWDVAHAALFLASDEAKYITGTTLVVDGGLTAKFA